MTLKFSSNIEETCAAKCPLECEYITYETSMSQLDFANRQHFDDLKTRYIEYENMSLEKYKKTHLRLNIHFKSSEYTEIREFPKMSALELIYRIWAAYWAFF
jgi:hypothetical protein